MARYHAYRLRSGATVLDCQANLLDFLQSRFVVPLLEPTLVPAPVHRLHPIVTVGESELIMATHLAAAVRIDEIGDQLASLESDAAAIDNALDMLLVGF